MKLEWNPLAQPNGSEKSIAHIAASWPQSSALNPYVAYVALGLVRTNRYSVYSVYFTTRAKPRVCLSARSLLGSIRIWHRLRRSHIYALQCAAAAAHNTSQTGMWSSSFFKWFLHVIKWGGRAHAQLFSLILLDVSVAQRQSTVCYALTIPRQLLEGWVTVIDVTSWYFRVRTPRPLVFVLSTSAIFHYVIHIFS